MTDSKKYKIAKYSLIGVSCFAYLLLAILVLAKAFVPTHTKTWAVVFIQAAGILVSIVPIAIELIFKMRFSILAYAIYLPFCILSLGLGSGLGFYDLLPNFDLFLHTISGVLIAFLLYASITSIIDSKKSNGAKLFLMFIISFAFTLAIGCIWEIWEFTVDEIAALNSQRYADPNGIEFIGHAALMDTMVDMISNTIGALISCIGLTLYYYFSKKEPKNLLFFKVEKSGATNQTQTLTTEKVEQNLKEENQTEKVEQNEKEKNQPNKKE